MRIKSVTQYRLSSLQPPRSSSAISQIQTNDPSPPSLSLRTCILSPTTSASESSGMWYLLRHVGNLAQTSSSIQTQHELLRIGTHISGGPAARTISEPSADFMSAPPQAPTGKLAPPQYVGNEVSAISADRGRGDACNEFHVQWRTDSRTSKRE